ncbi:hypothetical protein BDR06DRAFT_966810 [Suillus hirtellus]|nr:hypothetical protein BDR06DRAFT_966810 [Suillus hirtellus]
MTVPSEQANHALNITLATLQSLMKCCIKVKEDNPEALRLSDEIAWRVSHPHFDKTMDYLPPSSLDDLVIAATSTTNPPTVPTMATTSIPPSTLASPFKPSLMESNILAGPELEQKGSLDLGKEKAKDPPIPIDTPAAPPTKYNLFMAGTKKRKAAEEDMDTIVMVTKTKLPSLSEEPVKKGKIASKTISKTELGLDEDIATPWKQCDKCAKLDIACLVLPNKKFGNMRLACANCDSMKIACAIDGIGVWQRLQKGMSSHLPGMTLAHVASLEEEIKLALTNLVEPEPTAREILQGIQDLGRRLDLLAATEWMHALEVRVDSMEMNLLKRLDRLEQCLNESDARWKSLS